MRPIVLWAPCNKYRDSKDSCDNDNKEMESTYITPIMIIGGTISVDLVSIVYSIV